MNNVVLVGRITADPETNYITGENSNVNARFTVAVNRPYKNAEGKYDADFIRCVAWRNTAEFISKYFHKGDMIVIRGNIRTGSYTNKDGVKVYTTEVWVDNAEFGGSKGSVDGGNYSNQLPQAQAQDNSFMNVPDNSDEELPWG